MKRLKRATAILLMLAMLFSLMPALPQAAEAAGTLTELEYSHSVYEYNPKTQTYAAAYGDQSTVLQAALKEHEITPAQRTQIKNAEATQTVALPTGTNVSEDEQGRPQIISNYEGVDYTWVCVGFRTARSVDGNNELRPWTEAQLNSTEQPEVTFGTDSSRNYGFIYYVWVRSDRLAENVQGDYETVNITYHFLDHVLANGGQSVYNPFEIPADCDFSRASAPELYVSTTSVARPQEIRAGIEDGTIDKISETSAFDSLYNDENGTITIAWPKGYYVDFSDALEAELEQKYYYYVKVVSGDYEWYRKVEASSSWVSVLEYVSGSLLSSATPVEDTDIYAVLSNSYKSPIAAKDHALVRVSLGSTLEDGSSWSDAEWKEVRNSIVLPENDFPQGDFVVDKKWNVSLPAPIAPAVNEEDGSVILSDGNYSWKCVGIQNGFGADAEFIEHTDWRKPCTFTIEDSTALDSSGFGGQVFFQYVWKVLWEGEPPATYAIAYDSNPEGLTALGFDTTDYRIDAISYDESSEAFFINEHHDSTITLANIELYWSQIINETNSPVREQTKFTVGKYPESGSNVPGDGNQYYDLLIQNEESNHYFKFAGWLGEDGKTYDFGDTVTATPELAGEDGTITFKAQWEEFDALTEDELKALDAKLPLDVFFKGDDVGQDVVITQSTSADGNLDQNDNRTGDPVVLKEDQTISYQVSAQINSSLVASTDSNGQAYQKKFGTFTFHVNVDENLEFANVDENGKVTLNFSAAPEGSKKYAPVVLKSTNLGDNVEITEVSEGVYTITFDSNNVQKNADGTMDLQFTVRWNGSDYWQDLENHRISDTDADASMTVTGLEFKVKPGTVAESSGAPRIETSANITAEIDARYVSGNARQYYILASGMLNIDEWEQEFIGEDPDKSTIAYAHQLPEAYAKAIQLMNYKFKDYNLSADGLARLQANTVVANVQPAETVTIEPVNLTAYMGGDGGYDHVIADGSEMTVSTSLPHPLFQITGVENADGMVFSDDEKSWTVVADGNGYYHFAEGEGQEPVRVTYTNDKTGKTTLSDAFEIDAVGDVFNTYTVALYTGEVEIGSVTATLDGKKYGVATDVGTLTVRAVEAVDPTSDVVEGAAPASVVAAGSATAVVPEDTTYTLNGIDGVTIPDDAKPSLLFDDIIKSDGVNRTDALKTAVDAQLGGTNAARNYEYKYLDLVDANNGNAWIKANNPVAIYWGIPTENVNDDTEFTILHFKGLHRDGEKSGFEVEDVNSATIETITPERTEYGLRFEVKPGDFSPYVLVWETEEEDPPYIPEPTPDPDPDEPDTPDEPDVPDVDLPDDLNTVDHFSYVVGYEDGTVMPQKQITRAEVATIFYRLLEDDVRDDYDTTRNNFSDVTSDSWYNQTVSTLASMGILKGYEDGTFRPNASITRAEFAAIATRFFEETGATYEPGTFTDVTGSEWFAGAIMDAVNLGLIGGYEDGTVRPNNNITRAEACAIVNRTLGRVPDADHLLPEDIMKTWPDNPESAWFYADMQEATNGHEYEWIMEDGNKVENWTDLLDKDWNDR